MITTVPHCAVTPAFQAQFDALTQAVFGISFTPWIERGLWTGDYTAYVIPGADGLLASACTYRMELLVRGQPQVWWQIGAVATHPDQRGKGLSRRLLEHILAQHAGDRLFLLAHAGVRDFYPRFGFRFIPQHQPVMDVVVDNPGVAPLRLHPDDPVVRQMLDRRARFSDVLDCANAAPVTLFHLLMAHPGAVYALPEWDALVVAEQEGDALDLYDLVLTRPVRLPELLTGLPFTGVRQIRCHFNPDGLGIEYHWTAGDAEANLFVRGDWGIDAPFWMPTLITT